MRAWAFPPFLFAQLVSCQRRKYKFNAKSKEVRHKNSLDIFNAGIRSRLELCSSRRLRPILDGGGAATKLGNRIRGLGWIKYLQIRGDSWIENGIVRSDKRRIGFWQTNGWYAFPSSMPRAPPPPPVYLSCQIWKYHFRSSPEMFLSVRRFSLTRVSTSIIHVRITWLSYIWTWFAPFYVIFSFSISATGTLYSILSDPAQYDGFCVFCARQGRWRRRSK